MIAGPEILQLVANKLSITQWAQTLSQVRLVPARHSWAFAGFAPQGAKATSLFSSCRPAGTCAPSCRRRLCSVSTLAAARYQAVFARSCSK